jgi:hypothetical protein
MVEAFGITSMNVTEEAFYQLHHRLLCQYPTVQPQVMTRINDVPQPHALYVRCENVKKLPVPEDRPLTRLCSYFQCLVSLLALTTPVKTIDARSLYYWCWIAGTPWFIDQGRLMNKY